MIMGSCVSRELNHLNYLPEMGTNVVVSKLPLASETKPYRINNGAHDPQNLRTRKKKSGEISTLALRPSPPG